VQSRRLARLLRLLPGL